MSTDRQTASREGLSKCERLYGKSDISRLLKEGRFGHEGVLKFCWLYRADAAGSRVMVSVSKRFFKRAVTRNLLKRRLREAFRRSKGLLAFPGGCDLMLSYNSKEITDYKEIKSCVEALLSYISDRVNASLKEVSAE